MSNKPIHIISFDNPFPANYGGVIDVFYKVKALHNLGYEIHLHCFHHDRGTVAPELKAITKAVYLYPKVRRFSLLFSRIPFSVITRYNSALEANITAVKAPLLFEGLQTTMLLQTTACNTAAFLRLHNIESNFYAGIAASETNRFKKLLFFLESLKYRRYEKDLKQFQHVFTLSPYETGIVSQLTSAVSYVPVFHGNEKVAPLKGKGTFCLYHGDLRLPDNKKVAAFLIRVFKQLPNYSLVIASSAGKDFVEKHLKGTANIQFEWIKEEAQLTKLLEQAHVNVLWSFQKSGTKLKVINALFKSRFCLINDNMVDDEALLQLCTLANTETALIREIERLFQLDYTLYEARAAVLQAVMDDHKNAQTLSGLMEDTVA